jgi:hypothetical protein
MAKPSFNIILHLKLSANGAKMSCWEQGFYILRGFSVKSWQLFNAKGQLELAPKSVRDEN